MNLYEFEAKKIFRDHGIPVPKSIVITKDTDLEPILDEISFPIVIKSQVLTGKRYLAGGIKFADTKEEAIPKIQELFSMKIKKYPVEMILLEAKVNIVKEVYLSITIDQENNCPVFIVSSKGGSNIEQIAEEEPEKILKKKIDIFRGLTNYELRQIAKKLGINNNNLSQICKKMYTIFMEHDAELVEINPLALTDKGRLVAIDAKMIIDDKASYRQEIFSEIERKEDKVQKMVKEYGLSTYVELDGNIGVISDGAGTGMLTLDLIDDYGGKVANFCELGGVTNAETIENAMKIIMSNPNVKVLLISMIGGLNRMDEMAEGIIAFFKEHDTIPMVIRMCGTLEEVGKKMLHEEGFKTTDNLYEAIQKAVELSRGIDYGDFSK